LVIGEEKSRHGVGLLDDGWLLDDDLIDFVDRIDGVGLLTWGVRV